MYEAHFGFREKPFALTPDPAFLYMSRKHRMALTMLEYGVSSEAPIIVVSGEIGAGKTTLIRQLLTTLHDKATVGPITNTHQTFGELMQWVAMAFGLPFEGKQKAALYNDFVDFLLREYASGKRAVLIMDEAQNMDAAMLEELRVLSNINADKHLLLQLILVGQPELRDTLGRASLLQFAQRISVDYHLEALNLDESAEYIRHRLVTAGGGAETFTPEAIERVFELSAGVPRVINSLCDTALVYAFAEDKHEVTLQTIEELVADKRKHGLFGAGKVRRRRSPRAPSDKSGATS
jgi:general secretion pathway protein A